MCSVFKCVVIKKKKLFLNVIFYIYLDGVFYRQGIRNLVNYYGKCLNVNGDYIKKSEDFY